MYKIFDGENFVGTSKYALVVGVSKRARQLMSGEEPLVNSHGHKAVVVALREIEEEKVFLTTQKRIVKKVSHSETDIGEESVAVNSVEAIDADLAASGVPIGE
jgi:DNA-directed RNA polymerase subunit omega